MPRNSSGSRKNPTVKMAREMCAALKSRGVIIIALSADGVAGASYGETQRECNQSGYTLDYIIEAIERGEIPVWATK